MEHYQMKPVGIIRQGENGARIELEADFRPAMQGLDGFAHLQILWWATGCDNETARGILQIPAPYRHAPEVLGIFATRSPGRPNPIALSCAEITFLDAAGGVIGLAWIDADDGTPVLDIKPYTPSLDRVENPGVPHWCAHWPRSVETGDTFDWNSEFMF